MYARQGSLALAGNCHAGSVVLVSYFDSRKRRVIQWVIPPDSIRLFATSVLVSGWSFQGMQFRISADTPRERDYLKFCFRASSWASRAQSPMQGTLSDHVSPSFPKQTLTACGTRLALLFAKCNSGIEQCIHAHSIHHMLPRSRSLIPDQAEGSVPRSNFLSLNISLWRCLFNLMIAKILNQAASREYLQKVASNWRLGKLDLVSYV